jgi:hypothetical protein
MYSTVRTSSSVLDRVSPLSRRDRQLKLAVRCGTSSNLTVVEITRISRGKCLTVTMLLSRTSARVLCVTLSTWKSVIRMTSATKNSCMVTRFSRNLRISLQMTSPSSLWKLSNLMIYDI